MRKYSRLNDWERLDPNFWDYASQSLTARRKRASRGTVIGKTSRHFEGVFTGYPDGWDDSDDSAPYCAVKRYDGDCVGFVYDDASYDFFVNGELISQSEEGDVFEAAARCDSDYDSYINGDPYYQPTAMRRSRRKRGTRRIADWRYDADDYYDFIGNVPEGSWSKIDESYLTRVDTDIVIVEQLGNKWYISSYDEGYDTSSLLFGGPSPAFDTPREAIEWADSSIDWIGGNSLPKLSFKKNQACGAILGRPCYGVY